MSTGPHTREYVLDDTYSVRVFENFEGFLSLRETWDEVLRIHGTHEPFLCHEWFRIWLKHFLGDAELFITILYRDSIPVLIAPLIRKNELYKRILNVKKIELIGNAHSPIKNFIFGDTDPLARKKLLNYFFTSMATVLNDWDILELDYIPEENDNYVLIGQAIAENRMAHRDVTSFNDWLLEDINYSGSEYFNNRTKNCRKEIRRRTRRLEDEGLIEIDITNEHYNYEQYMQTYLDVRTCSWKHPENGSSFLEDYRKYAKNRTWLRFSALLLDGKPLSCHMRIVCNNVAYLMESVYDINYKEFSPTTILRSRLMNYLIDEEKVTTVDTIRGDEEYKKEWTPTKRERKCITLFNKTIKGYFFSFISLKLLPIIRKTRGDTSIKPTM